jgi:hypothetical protein
MHVRHARVYENTILNAMIILNINWILDMSININSFFKYKNIITNYLFDP